MKFAIELLKITEITSAQQAGLAVLVAECQDETINQATDLIFEPFAHLVAIVDKRFISQVTLSTRELQVSGKKVIIGGIGRVLVAKSHRHHGVVSSMLKRSLLTLKQQKSELACLATGSGRTVAGVYGKLGFKPLDPQDPTEKLISTLIVSPGLLVAHLS